MKRAFLAAALVLSAFGAAAQEPATITVSGAVQHPLTLTLSDLKAMPAIKYWPGLIFAADAAVGIAKASATDAITTDLINRMKSSHHLERIAQLQLHYRSLT